MAGARASIRTRSTLTLVARESTSVAILAAAHLAAFLIRFEVDVPEPYVGVASASLVPVVAVNVAALWSLRVHRRSWRFTSLADAVAIAQAILLGAGALFGLRALGRSLGTPGPLAVLVEVPVSVHWLTSALALIALVMVRGAWRMWNEERRGRSLDPANQRALVVGDGAVAAGVVRDSRRHAGGPSLVGLIADDTALVGQLVDGIRVVGTIERLALLVRRIGIDVVIVALDDPTPSALRRIVDALRGIDVELRIRPRTVLDGHEDRTVRPLDVGDLLGRAPVDIDVAGLKGIVTGAQVLVTGAGGSIGSELCRQLVALRPARIILFDRAETPLWAIDHELAGLAPDVERASILGDVADRGLLEQVITNKRPSLVLHAAALKHVPLLEANVGAAVVSNVLGTATVIDVCAAAGVERLVVVSTDKAVEPVSVMGASKRLGERYLGGVAARGGHRYSCVRFGNVLGSAGSVVPLFEQQIARGGPVTVTDAEMTRYFMTIPEACRLILQAALLGRGGETFVLDMGAPVRILDLAHDLIRLKGLEPGRDIAIELIGARPGERLHEELVLADEVVGTTAHPAIRVATGSTAPLERATVDSLHALVLAGAYDQARTALLEHANVRAPLFETGPSAPPRPAVPGAPSAVPGSVAS
ncbi:MAG: hypothetical protein RLZZ272_698 [Actinomycetota bacterium]